MATTELAIHSESLWQIDDTLNALLNSVDLCETDEQRAELGELIKEQTAKSAAKVDSTNAWLAKQDATLAAIGAEHERLAALAKRVQAAKILVEGYVASIILNKGKNERGEGLNGNTSRFSVKANPPSVDPDIDMDLLPEYYQAVEIRFRGNEWTAFLDALPNQFYDKIITHVHDKSPMKDAIKRDLVAYRSIAEKSGEPAQTIPGAHLAPTKFRLVRE
jgi:hypothetical protein